MSERATPRSRRPVHSRGLGLACALALAMAAAGVSTAVAQIPAFPQAPSLLTIPTLPETALTPGDTEGEPPRDDQDPPPSPAKAGPRKLDPFPVVIVAGRHGRRSTRVTQLSVKGPHEARVAVRCLGRGCPIRRAAATIPTSERVRVRKAQRVYRAGLVIEVRVTGEDPATGEDRVGKYTMIRFRRGRTPARSDACLQPDSTEPSACP
ncbi:MAG: hypothetical protein M3356_06000 [Actinomycetota bacterium]|nr:hypothetical protein [Actinomycetota bacterium]